MTNSQNDKNKVDVLILNTAVLDLKSERFEFVDQLVGAGGLAKCPVDQMPDYSQTELKEIIDEGCASAGGPGNTAPIIAKAGLNVAVGGYLGKGDFDGLDVQGVTFKGILEKNGVDVSAFRTHPTLPTGTTFINDRPGDERGGIAYFPNANDDFDFDVFKSEVMRLKPNIVYYMYSGLSEKGDARGGKNLADFMKWCRNENGCITITDSHTLVSDPQDVIEKGYPVDAYELLRPLLSELDIFFTSADEAKMIHNTLDKPRDWGAFDEVSNYEHFLHFLLDNYADDQQQHASLFGVTCSKGAMGVYVSESGEVKGPQMVESKFLTDQVNDLVGAGDSFRAGLISYIARHSNEFKQGKLNFKDAIQMGNLTAVSYITAPWENRYANIDLYEKMLKKVKNDK